MLSRNPYYGGLSLPRHTATPAIPGKNCITKAVTHVLFIWLTAHTGHRRDFQNGNTKPTLFRINGYVQFQNHLAGSHVIAFSFEKKRLSPQNMVSDS